MVQDSAEFLRPTKVEVVGVEEVTGDESHVEQVVRAAAAMLRAEDIYRLHVPQVDCRTQVARIAVEYRQSDKDYSDVPSAESETVSPNLAAIRSGEKLLSP